MRLRIDAEPGELASKGAELLHALAHEVGPFNEALADVLEKALPAPMPVLRHPVLKEAHDEIMALHAKHAAQMTAEILKVARSAWKGGIAKSEGDAPDGAEQSTPYRRRRNPGASPHSFQDPSKDTVDREAEKLAKLKVQLEMYGFEDVDYEPEGRLYGKSFDELRAIAAEHDKAVHAYVRGL